MTKICLKYEYQGKLKEFSCVGWSVYDDWLPYAGIKPLEMTVDEGGKVRRYVEFHRTYREKCGIGYYKITPKEADAGAEAMS